MVESARWNRAVEPCATPAPGSPPPAAYERVISLTDLTIAVHSRRGLRRELLRWRDLVAELYVSNLPEPVLHAAAFRVLLQFSPEASKQISALRPQTPDRETRSGATE